jgi:putative CocE/NonD family hydrolase
MGPWPHGVSQKVGDLTFPDNFNFDLATFERRFMDYWLKDVDDGIMDEPPIHYYTMGDCDDFDAPGNEWRTAEAWPPVPTVDTAFFLQKRGCLTTNAKKLRKGRARFDYDPEDPCRTRGGNNLLMPAGPFDQNELAERDDVITFMTPPLDAPMEVTGELRVKLYVSSTAPDTDFTAKLLDVYPDGKQILIADGIQRVKMRNGFDKPDLLPPRAIGELDVDLWVTSLVFNTGHSIGLQISSTNFPRFEINPNTGENFPREGHLKTARNTVHWGPLHPSALYLPVRLEE